MKILKAILRIVGVTLGLLILGVVGTALSLLYQPQWFITPKTLKFAAHFSSRFGAVLHWDELTTEVRSQSLTHRSLRLDFNNLCIDLAEPTAQACFEKTTLAFEIAWRDGGLRVDRVGPVLFQRGEIFGFLEPNEDKPPPREPPKLDLKIPQLVMPDPLRDARFEKILAELTRIHLMRAGEIFFIGSGGLDSEIDAQGRFGAISLKAGLEEVFGIRGSGVEARLASPSSFMVNDWSLSAKADIQKGELKLQGDLWLVPESESDYRLQLQALASQRRLKAKLQLSSLLRERHFQGTLALKAEGFEKTVRGAEANECRYDLKQPDPKISRIRLDFECPLSVDLTPMKLPSATFSKLVTVPYNLDFTVKSDLEMALFPTMDQNVSGNLEIEMAPVVQDLLKAKGWAKTQFSGVPSQYPKGWNIVTDLDLLAQIPEFQRAVQSLNHTAYAVPAPLNPLQGQIELGLSGRADITANEGKLPIKFKTDLASEGQSFKTEGTGEVNYRYGSKGSQATLYLDLTLPDLKIMLPRWGYSSLPSLFPDPRITNEKLSVKKSASQNLRYQVTIKTPKPARLVSSLAKEDIPLLLDLNLDNEKIGGTVALERTSLNFFRRNAFVENMQVKLQDPMNLSELNGRLSMKYTDYKISVLILGTVGKPRVLFESDPPLSEEQILSFLIYGRTFDDLDQNQSGSVSSMSSAFADRAIALGSLFVLASTPIESVGYNPATGQFSAKIRLAEGTSFNVQTTGSQYQRFGIRKTIKGNWIINTYMENDQEKDKRTGSAFLEWNKRY